ncbi:MAG: hypothetical protein ACJ8M1_02690 [Chthoniobacterales bacterium]
MVLSRLGVNCDLVSAEIIIPNEEQDIESEIAHVIGVIPDTSLTTNTYPILELNEVVRLSDRFRKSQRLTEF